MAALIPATSNVEAAYEDMFKEITRKLYGEETGNGLHTLGTPVAQVATTGPTAPEGERSFTNLQIDRSSAPTIEYEHNAGAAANVGGGNVATVTAAAVAAAMQQQQQTEGTTNIVVGESAAGEHHLSTAFGLAALMQNGFTQNNLQQQQQQQMSMNVNNKNASQANEQRWATNATGATTGTNDDVTTAVNSAGGNQQQAVQILHWTSAGKLQNYTNQQQQQQQPQQQQQLNNIKHKTSPTTTVTNMNMNLNSEQNSAATTNKNGTGGPRKKTAQHVNQQQQQQNSTPKRYACSHCPYSTDRRDLYTRHENIHKDEKPFQCYACLKQFNRADHVKKHFLRMHREMQYDINKTRRQVNNSNTGTGHQQRTSMSASSASGSPEQKPNIFHAANVQLENAFLQTQRQPTASSLSIAETIEAVATAADTPLVQLKQEKCDDINVNLMAAGLDAAQPDQVCVKPKREKRFSCCYCSWSGADKWGLKRHLNTHTKPFVCLLCDYKAARSERLATHILKVHNKRACNKCAFLADSQEEYQTHLNEVHPHDNRPTRHNTNSNSSSSTNTTMNSQNNFNVLCSIGSSLVTNTQLNNFPNASTFGVGSNVATNLGNSNAGGSVTIYTTTTTTTQNDQQNVGGTSTGEVAGTVGITGGPLQEIIVNPTSMVGWRLSANGSLIPPPDILTSGLPTAAAQKRGSERLFQYLEADGSDPEDYARLLKMDAMSRNTASVAQDFHKAGGVQELKIPANHQLLFNNRLLTQQWTAKEAAALLASLSNNKNVQEQQQQQQQTYLHQFIQEQQHQQQQQQQTRKRNHSTGEEDENTPSSASSTTSNDGEMSSAISTASSSMGSSNASIEQRKAMLKFLGNNFNLKENKYINNNNNNNNKYQINQATYINEDQENQEQLIESPPASSLKYKNNNTQKTKIFHDNNNNNNNNKKFRLDLYKDNKENTVVSATIDPNSMTNAAAAAQVAANYLTALEYQNMNSHNKIGTHFENYIKDIINKYYITNDMTTSMLYAHQQQQQQQPPVESIIEPVAAEEEEEEQVNNKRKRVLSETEGYIEYLKNKSDITLTITPKLPAATTISTVPATKRQSSHQLHRQAVEIIPTSSKHMKKNNNRNNQQLNNKKKSIGQIATLLPLLADAASKQQYLATPLDFSQKPLTTLTTLNDETTITTIPKSLPISNNTINTINQITTTTTTTTDITINNNNNNNKRKQAQPKKKGRPSPQVILARLRDKYLNRLVKPKLKCLICARKSNNCQMVFNYHSKATLTLHRLWKHPNKKVMKKTLTTTFPPQ